jgi:hypothetical protein
MGIEQNWLRLDEAVEVAGRENKNIMFYLAIGEPGETC